MTTRRRGEESDDDAVFGPKRNGRRTPRTRRNREVIRGVAQQEVEDLVFP